ncbi:uncharacterized protein LOC125664304 isoform X4 [Ostrea edulis]|uniref:uncharacterized protein LOC125664304 isoform X4 n=1 Tax=Ostrea edulis TaxID=37623 RepID=UPI0024AEDF20|nr:uncharacterized protein LOC125664304 isoform X4 [Ostrea edulis]
MSYRLATDFYMQQTTYKHDYNPGGISPRNRQTDYPYGADAPKADVPGPLNNFRPRFGDPLPQHIRDLDGQRFDEAPLTDRQRVKRGEEWIGGRRYEEPRTDRGRYYEMDGQRNISPNRRYDRMYRELDDGRHTSLDRPINKERMWESELERQNLRPGRHTSLDRYDTMDKRKENLKQYMRNRRQDPLEGGYPERGRNGSPERHLDRGREYERPRNESPSRWDRDRNTYNAVDDRRYDPSRDKYKYPDWYEKPLQPMMDSYANQQKMADRTTYRDYGEFLQDRIKREELRKQPLEYPAANLRDQLSHRDTYRERMFGPDTENRYYTRDNERFRNADKGRQAEAKSRREAEKIELHDGNFKPWARDAYQNPSHHPLRRELDNDNGKDNASVHDKRTEHQNTRPHTEPASQTWSDNLEPKSTNSGVYLFMRTHMDGKPDVVKALKEGRSVLANSYGQLKGIANSTEINLLEGLEGWNIRFNMTRTGDYWSERSQRTSGLDFIIIVFWFPSLNDAEKWVITERKFKNPHFPDPDGSDVVILPLNDSPPQERLAHTYMMTEYPRSFDPTLFRDTFAPRIKDLLWRKFGIDGFFIQCIRSRYIWGSWIKPSSLVTTIRFNSKSEANAFFNDPEYKQIRQEISRRIEQLPIHLNWFRPTTSMFTINEYV